MLPHQEQIQELNGSEKAFKELENLGQQHPPFQSSPNCTPSLHFFARPQHFPSSIYSMAAYSCQGIRKNSNMCFKGTKGRDSAMSEETSEGTLSVQGPHFSQSFSTPDKADEPGMQQTDAPGLDPTAQGKAAPLAKGRSNYKPPQHLLFSF